MYTNMRYIRIYPLYVLILLGPGHLPTEVHEAELLSPYGVRSLSKVNIIHDMIYTVNVDIFAQLNFRAVNPW